MPLFSQFLETQTLRRILYYCTLEAILYFVLFLSLKRQKITISTRREFHIRIILLKNELCP